MKLQDLLADEALRRHEFPVAAKQPYFAHAGVAPLSRAAADAMRAHLDMAAEGNPENETTAATIEHARRRAAELIGAQPNEIALLGPTSLGLSLVARGLDWRDGDEALYYGDDYPANVYPWMALARFGVRPIALEPEHPGVITPELVEAALTERTRLVALASCHFLSGYRIDIDAIGKKLRERGVLFCLDAIQSAGAFPVSVAHVDFLSADSHKWLLGPCGAGIFYVREALQDALAPALLGAWNVHSPDFVAQTKITFEPGARRYEPGALNLAGIAGLAGALDLTLDLGLDAISKRLLGIRATLLEGARALGYQLYIEAWEQGPDAADAARSAIVTLCRPGGDLTAPAQRLQAANIAVSIRCNRQGQPLLRFSPHFYNTEEEIARALACLAQ